MMRRILTTVGAGLGALVLATGTAAATCTNQGEDYTEAEGWTYVDVTDVIPAGFACNGAVQLHYRGHERTVETSATTSTLESGADVLATFTNVKTGRSITKHSDGDFYDTIVHNGRDLKTKGVGRNFFLGKGVRGIIYADGVQKFTVTRFEDPVLSTIHINKTTGKTVELCNRLGLRAVNGKNPPVEAEPQA